MPAPVPREDVEHLIHEHDTPYRNAAMVAGLAEAMIDTLAGNPPRPRIDFLLQVAGGTRPGPDATLADQIQATITAAQQGDLSGMHQDEPQFTVDAPEFYDVEGYDDGFDTLEEMYEDVLDDGYMWDEQPDSILALQAEEGGGYRPYTINNEPGAGDGPKELLSTYEEELAMPGHAYDPWVGHRRRTGVGR